MLTNKNIGYIETKAIGKNLSQEPEKIIIARELAGKMAYKSQMMRDIIKETSLQETETGSSHGQFEAFRDVLLHDLTEDQFADIP